MYEDFFCKRLSQLRNEKGVSARDLSIELGYNPGYVNAIENQNILPSMSAFFYICQYLEITPYEFFDPQNQYPSELRELIGDLNTLDHEQFRIIASLVKVMKK